MRIVAGLYRGRSLAMPVTKETRPTMDRTRQAVFNILRSASWALREDGAPILQGAHVLDVFAGSGAMGVEALSQGAAFATLIDNAPPAIAAIQATIDKIGLQENTRLLKADALKPPVNSGQVCETAFFDPPYRSGILLDAVLAARQNKYIDRETLLVMETHKHDVIDESVIAVMDQRLYGMAKIVFGKLVSPA